MMLRRWFSRKTPPVRQFAYISTAVDSLTLRDVAEIATRAQQRNQMRGLTGGLIYNGRNFFQILEGDEAEVVALKHAIARDPRHFNMSEIHWNTGPRSFDGWGMRFVSMLNDERPDPPPLLVGELATLWRSFVSIH